MRNEEKIHQLSEEAKKLLKMVFNSSKKEVRYADSGPEPIISIRGKALEPVDEIKVALRELVRADFLREKDLWSATFFKAKDATVFRVTVDGSEAGRELAKIAKLTEQMDKMIEQAKEHLDADEDVIAAVIGRYERERHGVDDSIRTAIFVATVDRVVLHCKRWLGYELEVFPYSNISSIEMGKGFLGHSITLFASNNTVRVKWISNGDVQQFIEYVRSKMGQTKEENAPSESTEDVPDQIRKLAELKDQGILTEGEFESKKKELLAKF